MVSAVYTADGFNVSGSWKVEKEIHLAAFSLGALNFTFERGMDHLIWDFLPKPLVIEFFPGIKQCKVFFFFTTVEALLTDTLVSGKLFLRPPSQKPDYFNSHTTLYFYIPASGQLQLQTPFSRPEGVRLRELPLYLYMPRKIFLFQCGNFFLPGISLQELFSL